VEGILINKTDDIKYVTGWFRSGYKEMYFDSYFKNTNKYSVLDTGVWLQAGPKCLVRW
jgi:hypothetical protein